MFIEQDDRLNIGTHEAQSCDGETAGIDADGDSGKVLSADLDSKLRLRMGAGMGQ